MIYSGIALYLFIGLLSAEYYKGQRDDIEFLKSLYIMFILAWPILWFLILMIIIFGEAKDG